MGKWPPFEVKLWHKQYLAINSVGRHGLLYNILIEKVMETYIIEKSKNYFPEKIFVKSIQI